MDQLPDTGSNTHCSIVLQISVWCCSFSLAVSVGAALLLPISTISNEVRCFFLPFTLAEQENNWNTEQENNWNTFLVDSPPLPQVMVHQVAQLQPNSGRIYHSSRTFCGSRNYRFFCYRTHFFALCQALLLAVNMGNNNVGGFLCQE